MSTLATTLSRPMIERGICTFLFETLANTRWFASKVLDGVHVVAEGPFDVERFLAATMSVDVATVRFVKDVGYRRFTRDVPLVFGNSGWDVVADHAVSVADPLDDFELLMDQVCEYASTFEPDTAPGTSYGKDPEEDLRKTIAEKVKTLCGEAGAIQNKCQEIHAHLGAILRLLET